MKMRRVMLTRGRYRAARAAKKSESKKVKVKKESEKVNVKK